MSDKILPFKVIEGTSKKEESHLIEDLTAWVNEYTHQHSTTVQEMIYSLEFLKSMIMADIIAGPEEV